MKRAYGSRQQGFSLVELAVVVVIVALISVAAISLVPLGGQALKQEHAATTMERANQALLGYLQANLALPYADADGDGKSDPGETAGWLPIKQLGLEDPLRIAYHAHPSLLAAPGDEFSPYLGEATTPGAPSINGLDLCRHLFNTSRLATPVAALGMPSAYVIAQPVAGNGLGIGTLATAQPLPGTADPNFSTSYAAGIGELAAQLNCSDRLGRAQGAAQSAYAAITVADLAEFNSAFRSFDVRTSEAMLTAAETGLAAAGTSLAFAIFDETIAVFLTFAGWPPSPLGAVVGVGEHAVASASIIYAIRQIKLSEDDVAGAEEALADAEAARDRAKQQHQTAIAVRDQAIAEAHRLDALGISR